MPELQIESFFDEATNTVSYVAFDSDQKKAAVIDPVLDYEAASGRTSHEGVKNIVTYLRREKLDVQWILETHVHADHLSGAQYIQENCGGKLAIGAEVKAVQKVFGKLFNIGSHFKSDGRQFDHLFTDGEEFYIGAVAAKAIHTPGHTPACMTYHISDAAFVGDTLFMPDYGTARCDFPGGDAGILYRSIQKIFSLPKETRLFTCHDYKTTARTYFAWESTVAEQMANNIHANSQVDEATFTKWRKKRDLELKLPALIIPSVQVNICGGKFPEEEDNGHQYLKIPINLF